MDDAETDTLAGKIREDMNNHQAEINRRQEADNIKNAANTVYQIPVDDLDEATKMSLAGLYCKPEITRRLRSPSTADFPWLGQTTVQTAPDKLTWSSYIDAQNGFGAIVRQNFACTIRFLGGDAYDYHQWTFDSIQM